MKKYAVAAAVAVALIGGGSGVYGYYKVPVKYLSLDVNPSIELGVSMSGDVVAVDGVNDDGKTVLEGVDVVGTDVKEAVQTIVESASDKEFIEADGSSVVSITTETKDADTDADELTAAAEEGVTQALENENKVAEVVKSKIALARRDEARELGISPGKLNLIQKLQKLDSTVTVDQYKDAKVKEIMKAIKDKRKEVKADLKAKVKEEVDQTVEEGKTEIKQSVEEKKNEIKQEVEQKKNEIKQNVQEKKSEIKKKIEEKKNEIRAKVQQIKDANKNNTNGTETEENSTESDSE